MTRVFAAAAKNTKNVAEHKIKKAANRIPLNFIPVNCKGRGGKSGRI